MWFVCELLSEVVSLRQVLNAPYQYDATHVTNRTSPEGAMRSYEGMKSGRAFLGDEMMSVKFARILGAAVLIISGAVAAQADMASDKGVISNCIKQAQSNSQSPVKCVGTVADPCIAKVSKTANDVEEAKACARRELAVWDERLKAAIKIANGGGYAEMRPKIKAAQENWATSQKSICPIFDTVDPGMALGGANYCRMQDTAQRALILERLAAAVVEH